MKSQVLNSNTLISLLMTVTLAGCAGQPGKEDIARATEGYVEDVNKLFVVDCLLPGQVRKLGSQMTYLTQRRPVRTTAADCEIRGGEYVAYDRANMATALKVWLARAEEGDAEAQLRVGEIYEKGIGRQADYRAAALWYRKAAEKGDSQAQINLGHLYELGLGVPRDKSAALSWYARASGLDSASLQFTPAPVAPPAPLAIPAATPAPTASADQQKELESLRAQVLSSRQEVERLREQLSGTQRQLLDEQDRLRKSQDELDALRQRLQQEKTQPVAAADDGTIRQLEQQLRDKSAQINAQQSKLAAMNAALKQERQRVKSELASAQAAAKPAAKAPKADTAGDHLRTELQAAESSLGAKIEAYQKNSAELTRLLTQPAAGDPLAARSQIDQRKRQLQQDAMDISALKEKADQLARKLDEAEKAGIQVAAAGPSIEILEPQVVKTRGIPAIQVRPDVAQIVGRIQAPDGLKSFNVDGQSKPVDPSGVFRIPVPGEKTALHLIAVDGKDKQADLTVSLLQPAAEQTSVTPSGTAGSPSHFKEIDFGRYHALIIGNNDYAAYPALKTAVNDARSVEVILRERYGFNTKLLLNANRYTLMSTLNEYNKKLTEQDNLLIYYAGHGEIDQGSQVAYWLPTDAEKGNPANWISSQSISELLSIMPARHIMVVADSCYSGALAGSAVAVLPAGMDPSKREKWMKAMTAHKTRTVLTSGGVQPVLDEGGSGHSIFANAFLKILRSNQDILEDYNVYRAVAEQVRSGSARAGLQQSPQYAPLQHAGHEGSPFFLVPESA